MSNFLVKTEEAGQSIYVTSPYNANNVALFKKWGATWDSASSRWVIPAIVKAELEDLLLKKYGSLNNDGESETTVEIQFGPEGASSSGGAISAFSFHLVKGFGRDSGTKTSPGWAVVQGGPGGWAYVDDTDGWSPITQQDAENLVGQLV